MDLDLSTVLKRISEGATQVSTLYNKVVEQYEPISIVQGTPQAGYPEGRLEVNTKSIIERAADVVTSGTSFYEQVKGLFGLGYPAVDAQPTSPVTTTTKQAPDLTAVSPVKTDVMILVVIGIILFFMLK